MSSQERLKDRLKNKLFHLFVSVQVHRNLRLPSPNCLTGPSFFLLLPSELKHRIAELSSHVTLASLARTHTAFQREAEQALYRTLSDPSLKCLETLATNSEKAGFVHFLTLECFYQKKTKKEDHWRAPIDYLLNGLSDMHCLSDFRLRLPRGYEVQPWIESLDKILCNNHFQLRTLCCDEDLDLSRIITSQTELQMLGIYEYYDCEYGFMGTLKQLQNAQLHLPVVFALEYGCCEIEGINRIGIFPPFYDCHSTVHQALAKSFDDIDQDSYTLLADASVIGALSIYLVDSCDFPSVHALTKNMSMMFPNIFSLTISFENPCEKIPSQEIKKIISLFPDLSQLGFEVWPPLDIGDGDISGDVKRAHEALAKDWVLACPKLISVSFIDGSTLQKDGFWGSEWSLTEGL